MDARNLGSGLVRVDGQGEETSPPQIDVLDLIFMLADRVDTVENVLVTVINIAAEYAEQPHTMAEELKSLLFVPEEG